MFRSFFAWAAARSMHPPEVQFSLPTTKATLPGSSRPVTRITERSSRMRFTGSSFTVSRASTRWSWAQRPRYIIGSMPLHPVARPCFGCASLIGRESGHRFLKSTRSSRCERQRPTSFTPRFIHARRVLDERASSRQALAGLLWSKQSYIFDVNAWLEGDDPSSPPSRRASVRESTLAAPQLAARHVGPR